MNELTKILTDVWCQNIHVTDAERLIEQSHEAELNTNAIGFSDWLRNHWFVPTSDGWMINHEHIECGVEPLAVNWFSSEELYKAFVKNGSEPYSEFDHKLLNPIKQSHEAELKQALNASVSERGRYKKIV